MLAIDSSEHMGIGKLARMLRSLGLFDTIETGTSNAPRVLAQMGLNKVMECGPLVTYPS